MEIDPPQRGEIVSAEPVSTRSPSVLRAVLMTSSLGLLISIFRWKVVSMITLFIEPFIEFVIFGSFFAVFIWASIFAFVPPRRFTRSRFIPFTVAWAALLIFVFVPFTKLAIKVDFRWKLSQRTAAAERIVHSSGIGASKVGGIGERVELPGLSDDDEGFYWQKGGKQMVLFFTFRGVLGHFSGFVYSETDAPPTEQDFGCPLVEVERFRPKWYWIACR